MSPRSVLRGLVPPVVADVIRRRRSVGLRLEEVDGTWATALGRSDGYADADILRRVVAANRAVARGEGAFERDGVVFEEPDPPLGLLVGLLRSAAQDRGRLDVVDVGGSLGTSYRRCAPYLASLAEVRWHVVEQAAFVDAGRAEFASDSLRFVGALSDVEVRDVPPTYVLASVLQYLEDPYGMLRSIAERPGRHLVIERTPMSDGLDDVLVVQHAPADVYAASYPSWIFSDRRLAAALEPNWRLVGQHPSPEGSVLTDRNRPVEYRDQLYEARS